MNPLMCAYLVIGVIATAMYVWAVHHRTSRVCPHLAIAVDCFYIQYAEL
jgi:hypothetical protein